MTEFEDPGDLAFVYGPGPAALLIGVIAWMITERTAGGIDPVNPPFDVKAST
jgi:hypothetical protein